MASLRRRTKKVYLQLHLMNQAASWLQDRQMADFSTYQALEEAIIKEFRPTDALRSYLQPTQEEIKSRASTE